MNNMECILVVDDDARWRKIITETLTDAGFTVKSVLPHSRDPLPGCRAAVLDVSLSPSRDDSREGLAIAASIDPTPVILLSGTPAQELDAPVRAHSNIVCRLEKSAFRPEVLVDAVRKAVSAGPVASGTIASNVLIVEDDPGWRSIYTDILADGPYHLHFAISYGEARGLLQRSSFEVAVVDLHLISSADPVENRDGFWLLRAANQRSLPTIVVSATGAPEDIDRAYDEFGVFAFVEKEAFDRKAFAQTIADAIRSAAAPPVTVETAAAGNGLPGNLTDREREVLALMALGHTNRQIGEALIITPNTVKKHVDHVLQKLGVSSRAAAAAIAARAGLGGVGVERD